MGTPNISEFQGLARTSAMYGNQCSVGINPLTQPIKRPCVYTRFLTEEERRKQHHLDQCKSEVAHLKFMAERSKRREANLQFGRNLCMFMNRIAVEELQAENQQSRRRANAWKSDVNNHAAEVIRMSLKKQDRERDLDIARKQLARILKDHDEMKWIIHTERQKTEASENRRRIAISSLRSRWEIEKGKMEDEIQVLRNGLITQKCKMEEETQLIHEMLQKEKCKTCEIKSFAEESVQHIEKLEGTVAKYEKGEMMDAISQRLSNVLSDISEIAMVRPDDDQSVPEKIRDIRECIQDLVKELKSRRSNADKLAERNFALEEQRLLWATNERMHEREIAALKKALLAASKEIAQLKNEEQRDRIEEGSSSEGAVSQAHAQPLRC